jgi:hypothetical protein
MYKEFRDFWNKKWENVWFIWNTDFSLNVLKYIDKKWHKLIDIWCWRGRDSIYFASLWFDVNSFDFSENAINWLINISEEKKAKLNPILWNIIDYNFKVDFYDVVYACNSLHYFSKSETKIIFEKLKKSLKKWWYIFIRVKSIYDTDFWKWEILEENFYKNLGDIKYYFDVNFLKELFLDFEILELKSIQDTHNKIDSTTTINWFVDLVAKKK